MDMPMGTGVHTGPGGTGRAGDRRHADLHPASGPALDRFPGRPARYRRCRHRRCPSPPHVQPVQPADAVAAAGAEGDGEESTVPLAEWLQAIMVCCLSGAVATARLARPLTRRNRRRHLSFLRMLR